LTAPPGRPVLSENDQHPRYLAEDSAAPLQQRLAPELLERYVIERQIGHGGAAYVFLAEDPRTRQRIAIKVLRPELLVPAFEERFQREIKIVRSLEHPNILPILDFGKAGGQHYFTMPFVEGPTLRIRIRNERQLNLREAIRIARDIASALDYAHTQGVIHRDIKPANILLEGPRTLVADFGIARAMIVASGDQITPNSGIAIGTVEYMSPEQAEGHRSLDGRSDIYGLGCVVYEMLAGEPPFTGPTAQAIVARHCHEAPRLIRVIRPAVPPGVERAVLKALAKVPADRFDTASAFVDALEAGLDSRTDVFGFARFSRRQRYVAGVALTATAAATAWYATTVRSPPLDPNRIVVFPLTDRSGRGEGEDAATFIGYALDATRPLKWRDGWELLDGEQRPSAARLSEREARQISRRDRAAFYIDGSVVRRPDSMSVILRLHDVAGDSVVKVEGRSAAAGAASIPVLSVDAMAGLLPALIAPGGRIDVAALTNRRTTAIANFLQAEREYRRMRFRSALPLYETALREDSGFTLAALRGAYAANWLSDFRTATSLAEIALRDRQTLPLAQELLARGLYAYLIGSADTAVFYVRAALRSDSMVHAGWALLGEVSSRLLPTVESGDSLVIDALERARRLDPDFAPTLLMLWEIALLRGDIREVLDLGEQLRAAGADTTHEASRALMLRCVSSGPQSVNWLAAVRRDANAVLASAKTMAGRGSQPECAASAFRALLDTSVKGGNARWASFLGLQTVLAATNHVEEAAEVFRRKGLSDLPLRFAYVLIGAEGIAFQTEAAAAADSAAASYRDAGIPTLWALAAWEHRRGNSSRLRDIASELRRRADSSNTRRDRLIANAVAARLPLLEGDTAAAITQLRALTPSATRQGIAWEPWESLGPERMLLAKLLRARGDCAGAGKVAAQLDATEPLAYPLYLRGSLDLRVRCASDMGDASLAAHYHRRLRSLVGST
jgi:serine/threonine protein kinase/tetratricopeptide (TPR) repeat protein